MRDVSTGIFNCKAKRQLPMLYDNLSVSHRVQGRAVHFDNFQKQPLQFLGACCRMKVKIKIAAGRRVREHPTALYE